MVNDLQDGYVYLLEDEGDWVPTVANIDLATNFTEGTEFCKFKFPKQWTSNELTGITASLASGGAGFMERSYRRGYIVEFITNEDFTNLAYIRQFLLANAHTASDPAVYVPYYLIMRRSVSDYVKFYNNSGNQVDYLQGAVPNGGMKIIWNESENLRATVHIRFAGVWR